MKSSIWKYACPGVSDSLARPYWKELIQEKHRQRLEADNIAQMVKRIILVLPYYFCTRHLVKTRSSHQRGGCKEYVVGGTVKFGDKRQVKNECRQLEVVDKSAGQNFSLPLVYAVAVLLFWSRFSRGRKMVIMGPETGPADNLIR
jgi:hypothetical protein